MKIETFDDWQRFTALREGARHWELHRRKPNGAHVFAAFLECRRAGVEVPEAVMRQLDAYAEALLEASGTDAIAAAIQMTGTGGAAGATKARELEAARDVVEYVAHRLPPALGGMREGSAETLAAAIGAAAHHFGRTEGAVKALWNRWRSDAKDANAKSPQLWDVFR